MKRFLLALIFLISLPTLAFNLKEEFKDGHYGLHLISTHAENRGTNNGNFGVYLRTKSGFTVGQYHNSCDTYTNYYGWSFPEWYRITFTPAIASGYHCLTEKVGIEEGKRWNFTIAPTIRVATWENVGDLKEVSIRALIVPGLYHLMVETRF